MTRPHCLRHVGYLPNVTYFKPAGVPICDLEEVTVTLDELEALRLADLEGQYQDQAADKMKISRPTFGRIVETARRKVAEALIHGKALRLEGGAVVLKEARPMPDGEKPRPVQDAQGMGRGCHKQRRGRYRKNQSEAASTPRTDKGKQRT